MNNIDVLKNALTIKPLIFTTTSEKPKQYNFVKPYLIDSSVRPVTDDDIKTLKTYLNAIIKLDRYHGTANVAAITQQGMQANTQSSDEVARFLDERNIRYDMFDNQSLETALKNCQNCKIESQKDAKTMKKAKRFLQTLIKQPLINKKASDQVTNYLNAQQITYSAVSKKSLRKAIKDCKKKPACQGFEKEAKQNAINYLTGLLYGKRARKIQQYQDVRTRYSDIIVGILIKLGISCDNSVIKKYLRKEHTEKLETIVQGTVTSGTGIFFKALTDYNPDPDSLGKYDEACTRMFDAVTDLLKNLNNTYIKFKDRYNRCTDPLVPNAKKENGQKEVLIHPLSASEIHSLGREVETMSDITNGMKSARALVRVFDNLVETAENILSKIKPMATYLKRCSGKARMVGKSTLYTKMHEELEEELRNVRRQVTSLLSARNTLICVGCGLMCVDSAGNADDIDNSVMELLSSLESFNNISTTLNNHLKRDEALPGSYEDLLGRHRQQSEYIRQFAELVKTDATYLNGNDLASGRNSPNLPQFVDKLRKISEAAESSVHELSAVASGIDEFTQEAKHSVVGRIALFKERHRVSIDTAKNLGRVVKQLVETIPN